MLFYLRWEITPPQLSKSDTWLHMGLLVDEKKEKIQYLTFQEQFLQNNFKHFIETILKLIPKGCCMFEIFFLFFSSTNSPLWSHVSLFWTISTLYLGSPATLSVRVYYITQRHNFDQWLQLLLRQENLRGSKKIAKVALYRRQNQHFVEHLVHQAEQLTREGHQAQAINK